MEYSIEESGKHINELAEALTIYMSMVDKTTSYTSTNEIKDYILNKNKDPRKMFFFNLYVRENHRDRKELYGFSEFGYLPETQTLVIDYICTKYRNPLAFGMFYQLAMERIVKSLNKAGNCIKYIITEISLAQIDGVYCDEDSNYFRQVLMNENYVILKFPYFQPALDQTQMDHPEKFAIAIRSAGQNPNDLNINGEMYLSIIKELYNAHYGDWYKKYRNPTEVDNHLKELLNKIKKLIVDDFTKTVQLVHCPIFETGKCKQVDIQPMTINKRTKRRIWLFVLLLISCLFVAAASVVSFYDCEQLNVLNQVFSLISFISSGITIAVFLRDFFRK